MGFIDTGKKEGAALLHGGNQVGKRGYFIEPRSLPMFTTR